MRPASAFSRLNCMYQAGLQPHTPPGKPLYETDDPQHSGTSNTIHTFQIVCLTAVQPAIASLEQIYAAAAPSRNWRIFIAGHTLHACT